MKGSALVVMWAFMLLSSVLTLCALLTNQIIVSYYLDPSSKDVEVQHKIFLYFGTFSRSMLTMFEITLGNWGPVAWMLVEDVSEWWMIFSLVHKLTIGFAVVGVINSMFIQETFKVAAYDDLLMLLHRDRAQEMHAKKMHGLFAAADTSGDGSRLSPYLHNEDTTASQKFSESLRPPRRSPQDTYC